MNEPCKCDNANGLNFFILIFKMDKINVPCYIMLMAYLFYFNM